MVAQLGHPQPENKPAEANKGRFKKGQSGNPGGRPKGVAEVRELARQLAPEAVDTLAEIMRSKKAPPAARVAAAKELLDRGFGKSPQAVDVTSDGESLVKVLRGVSMNDL